LTAMLLIAAFVIFLVGAGFWLVREFEQPLEPKLRAVAAHRRRWVWIHSWMVAGTITSVAAVTLLVRLLKSDGGGSLATTALAFFAFGCAGFLVSLAVGLTATPKAAVAYGHCAAGLPSGASARRCALRRAHAAIVPCVRIARRRDAPRIAVPIVAGMVRCRLGLLGSRRVHADAGRAVWTADHRTLLRAPCWCPAPN
jgi:hypothetical protein